MKFVINKLKYDTNNMDLISDKCEYSYADGLFGVAITYRGRNVKLWKSKKDNWLLTFDKKDLCTCSKALTTKEAQGLLLKYDVDAYEKIFGELEEA